MTESKRIRDLRLELAKLIPKFPNNQATLRVLQEKRLVDLFVVFLNWRVRFVSPRPREVRVEMTATSDARWSSLSADIGQFLKRVERGDDLTPHLSSKVHRRGFRPTGAARGASAVSWEDKDFLLNVMGLHHFHPRAGSNEVLFASVSRDRFDVIGIFDHKVFENAQHGVVPAERARLWSIFEDLERRHALPGALILGGMGGLGVTLSGHPVTLLIAAQRYDKRVRQIDAKLDDPAYIQNLYAPNPAPLKSNLIWILRYLDLGVLDKCTNTFFVFEKGPN